MSKNQASSTVVSLFFATYYTVKRTLACINITRSNCGETQFPSKVSVDKNEEIFGSDSIPQAILFVQ